MKLSSSIFLIVLATFLFENDGIRLKEPRGFQDSKNLKESFYKAGRVIGGEIAKAGSAPYQVSLQPAERNVHWCGGSILNANWVLTAAHCVEGIDSKDLAVATGTNRWEEPGAKYFVDKIYIHCNYNNPPSHNDIALIHLNSSIKFDERTKQTTLPTKPLRVGQELILTGWGSTENWGSTPKDLQKVTLKFVEHNRCQEMLNNDPNLDIGHICTFTRKGEGACHGDSGGPLVNLDGEVEGVVNWGYPCAIGVPDAFASVFYYRSWIRDIQSGNTKC